MQVQILPWALLINNNMHEDRPWYWKLLDRCQLCYSYGRLRKINRFTYAFVCAKCRREAESGPNVGVAICNWNKLQRKRKFNEKDRD